MGSSQDKYVPPHKRSGSRHSNSSAGSWRSNISPASSSPSSTPPLSPHLSPLRASPPRNNGSYIDWGRRPKSIEDQQWDQAEVGRVYFLDKFAIDQSRHIRYWAKSRVNEGLGDHPVIVLHKERDADGNGLIFFKTGTSNEIREAQGWYKIGEPRGPLGENILQLTPDTTTALPKTTFVTPAEEMWIAEPSVLKTYKPGGIEQLISITAESIPKIDNPRQRKEMLRIKY